MSGSPQVPRLLAALLGVEVAPPPGWAAQQQPPPPPAGQPASAVPLSRSGAGVPERIGRRPADQLRGTVGHVGAGETGADRTARRRTASPTVPARRDRRVPTAVREAVATPAALRVGVVLAEVLGAPRALRPYRPEGPLAR